MITEADLSWPTRLKLGVSRNLTTVVAWTLILSAGLFALARHEGAPLAPGVAAQVIFGTALTAVLGVVYWSGYRALRRHMWPLVALLTLTTFTSVAAFLFVWALPDCPGSILDTPARCAPPEAAAWGLSTGLMAAMLLLLAFIIAAPFQLLERWRHRNS